MEPDRGGINSDRLINNWTGGRRDRQAGRQERQEEGEAAEADCQ